MKFGEVPVSEAAGKILAHTVLDANGHKIFGKGHILAAKDVEVLRACQFEMVMVAALEAADLNENDGARRVSNALAGDGVRVLASGVGRGNLIATVNGPLRINVPVLERINTIYEGITVATMREYTVVEVGQIVALVKIIPFGIPESFVEDVEAIAHDGQAVIAVRPLQKRSVGLIISGPVAAKDKLIEEFEPSVRTRIERYNSQLDSIQFSQHEVVDIAEAIRSQITNGRELIILAGVSAIIDREDIAPQAVRAVHGSVTQFGVPVDPGSLLMLGYVGSVPIIGAPGCVKSLKTNVIDWILPRLLTGERLTRADLVAMGHGGLLEDIEDRPMPRDVG